MKPNVDTLKKNTYIRKNAHFLTCHWTAGKLSGLHWFSLWEEECKKHVIPHSRGIPSWPFTTKLQQPNSQRALEPSGFPAKQTTPPYFWSGQKGEAISLPACGPLLPTPYKIREPQDRKLLIWKSKIQMLSSLKCPFENIVDDGYYLDNAVNFCSLQKIFLRLEKWDIGHLPQNNKAISLPPNIFFTQTILSLRKK